MAYEIYVIMQKRSDGKVYSDMHKVLNEKFYYTEQEAEAALEKEELKAHFHIVKMIAQTFEEWLNDYPR